MRQHLWTCCSMFSSSTSNRGSVLNLIKKQLNFLLSLPLNLKQFWFPHLGWKLILLGIVYSSYPWVLKVRIFFFEVSTLGSHGWHGHDKSLTDMPLFVAFCTLWLCPGHHYTRNSIHDENNKPGNFAKKCQCNYLLSYLLSQWPSTK